MNINLLKLISGKSITFIKDLQKDVKINGQGKFKYFDSKCYFNINDINLFLNTLNEKHIYEVIPFISASGNSENPWLTLSRIFLVTKFSNHEIIYNYFKEQYYKSCNDFNMNPTSFILTIKYRPIEFTTYH